VIVQINSRESVPAALEEFIALMKKTGVTPTGQINESVPHGKFRIIIGSKPEVAPPLP
jgi:hypothetical protein